MASSRQWPQPSAPMTTTSTLSPLAPPFTVDRRALPAYDYPSYIPSPAVGSGDLLRVGPYYPQYDRTGGALRNTPFDEGSAELPARDSFPSSSSSSSSSSSTWIGAGASADRPQGVLPDAFAGKNIWCSNQPDGYGRKYLQSDHQEWQHDKSSDSNPVRSSASVFSPVELVDASFNFIPPEVFSKGLGDTPSSASHCYFGSTIQNGSYRDREVGFHSGTPYCPHPQAPFFKNFSEGSPFVEKDPEVERSCIGRGDQLEKYVHTRHRVSVSIREPDTKSNVDIVCNRVKSNGTGDNSEKSDAIPLDMEMENPASGHGLCTEETTKLYTKHVPTVTSFAVSSVETGNFCQNTEVVDHLNLAEDSPCWKGAAIASRQSPFHIVNISSADSQKADEKFDDYKGKAVEGVTSKGSLLDSLLDEKYDDYRGKAVEGITSKGSLLDSLLDPLEKKKEVLNFDDFMGGFQGADCDDALFGRRVTSSSNTQSLFQNEMAFEPVSKPIHGSLYSSFPTSGKSLVGFSHHGGPVAPPKSHDSSATSAKFGDGRFLFRSLCDLSSFCLSYCNHRNVLNDDECELLSITRHNVDACLSKGSIAGEKKKCQYDPSQVHDPKIESNNNSSSRCKDRGIFETPKVQPLHSDVDCDMHGGHLFSGLDLTEDISKNFAKLAMKGFNGEEEDTELNLYKKLWIEAEVALCRMKYELRFARAKLEPQHNQQNTTKAMQEPSGTEKMAEQMEIIPFVSSQPNLNIENDSSLLRKEFQTGIDLNLENDTSRANPEQVSTSGVLSTAEDDSSVMARFRLLISRANRVDSSISGSPDQLHDCITVNPDLEAVPISSNPSCTDGQSDSLAFVQRKWDTGPCLQAGPPRSTTGGNSSANAGVPETPEEAVSGSYSSHPMGSFQRQADLPEVVEGDARFLGYHNIGGKAMIDSYIPSNVLHANKFQGGKNGSTSSDWEHVREEDVVW